MVARVVRDDEVAGSNPVTPTATALVPLGTRAVLLFRGLCLLGCISGACARVRISRCFARQPAGSPHNKNRSAPGLPAVQTGFSSARPRRTGAARAGSPCRQPAGSPHNKNRSAPGLPAVRTGSGSACPGRTGAARARPACRAAGNRLGRSTTRTGPRQGLPRCEPVPVMRVHAELAQRKRRFR